ncbi:FG-GAP repeat domain-containing protein [Streptomyces sp. Qhu_M48]|uniref:FG-GAP repeat domain-containing protein n=1 Tax=Streptomyces sp. Qhu_M48 TaxID=3435889 RepID=UPI003F503B38
MGTLTGVGLGVPLASAVPALPASAVPAAAVAPGQLPPWNQARPVSDRIVSFVGRQQIVVASDGSAVALWKDAEGGIPWTYSLYMAVRGPKSSTWSAPQRLSHMPTARGEIQLVAGSGDEVMALWAESPHHDANKGSGLEARVVAATVNTRTLAWSAPVELLPVSAGVKIGRLRGAAGSDGSFAVAWSGGPEGRAPAEISAAVRGADGTWGGTAEVAAAVSPQDVLKDPDVTVDATGSVVVAYIRAAGPGETANRLETVTRSVSGTAWSEPVPLTPSIEGVSQPELSTGPDGTTAIAWRVDQPDADGKRSTSVYASVRAPGSAAWGPQLKVFTNGHAGFYWRTPKPLVSPDGTVTLVWLHPTADASRTPLYASALGRTDSSWSTPINISTSLGTKSPSRYGAAIGTDGTLRATWSQTLPGSGSADLVPMETARNPRTGAWTAPVRLSQNRDVTGNRFAEIAVGADGAGAALLVGGEMERADQLLAARTSTEPAAALTGSNVRATAVVGGTGPAWDPSWTANQAVRWALTLKDPAGRTIRTQSGTAAAGEPVRPRWDGQTSAARPAPNGPLGWELAFAGTELASDPVVLARGTVSVRGGAAVDRDYGSGTATPDGTGDFFQTTASGSLRIAYGNRATGNFSGSSTSTGWPAGFRPVPFGDTSGDRCNDTLVRLATGEMRLYTPACGAALKPTTQHKVLGKGWNAYDVLTAVGDVNKDSRPDLVARDPKTGGLYLYTTTSTGILSPRVSLGTAFKGYKKIVGAGDLTGDGIGDLLLQDASNELWRMNGTGTGTFAARTLVAEDFSPSYTTLVVPGDLTGDGRADLLARDSAGTIWRWNGTGKGTFEARTKLATGWQVYNSVH